MRASITYTFTGPTRRRSEIGRCPVCNKKVKRSRTFENTVSPFNCKVIGGERIPKTWDEVAVDVAAEAAAWVPDFTHAACRTEDDK